MPTKASGACSWNWSCRPSKPVVLITDSNWQTPTTPEVHFATEQAACFLDGFGDGICLGYAVNRKWITVNVSSRTYLSKKTGTSSPAIQLSRSCRPPRTRISKTGTSVARCSRTLFDLQETTAKIRAVTNHPERVKIAIMGCIVNGPGEMADADFGYVGSGPGKITLYKGSKIVKRICRQKWRWMN